MLMTVEMFYVEQQLNLKILQVIVPRGTRPSEPKVYSFDAGRSNFPQFPKLEPHDFPHPASNR